MPLKKCPPGQIENKSTGRCVKKDGPLGKKLVKSVTWGKQAPKSPIKIFPK